MFVINEIPGFAKMTSSVLTDEIAVIKLFRVFERLEEITGYKIVFFFFFSPADCWNATARSGGQIVNIHVTCKKSKMQ